MTMLQHVTLNTGNLEPSPRDQVLPKTVRWLSPMVRKGGGAPAGIPFAITTRGVDTALFSIGEPPAVLCACCWSDDRSAEAWAAMLVLMHETGMTLAPAACPHVPWLAVLLLPGMAAMPAETVAKLGDMERCLAWTLIQSASPPG
jgi:hypothetical protein